MIRTFFSMTILLLALGCGTPHRNYVHRDLPPPHPAYKESDKKLWEKAEKIEANLYRFISPDGHLVYYRVNPPDSPPQPGNYGNLADCPIWTGALLGAETFRFRVTRSPQALDKIRRLVQGLHFLQAVTGVPGLLARFFDHGEGPNPSEEGHPSWRQGQGKFKNYRYRADPSKDQYSGVLFGYSVAYHLLKDAQIRTEIRRDALAIADHLIRNEYNITGADGEQTNFGDLQGRVYGVPVYLNALISLHAIALARTVSDGAPKYEKEWQKLMRFKYHKILKFSKFQILGNTNHNNDNMAFLSYYGLWLNLPEGDPVRKEVEKSARHLWTFIKAEGNAFWNFAYFAYVEEDPKALRDALRNLYLYPPHTRGYTVDSRGLEGIKRSIWPNRKGKTKALYPLPLNLRGMSSFIWKTCPYALYRKEFKEGVVFAGTGYLLAYWMGRYHRYIDENM